MADVDVVNAVRPNIRIEIHNNIMEAMNVDDTSEKLSEGEEGEIIEESVDFDDIINDKITYPTRPLYEKQKKSLGGAASKGIPRDAHYIHDKQQRKESDRAKHFLLDQTEVANFTSANLISLHESLGINVDNEKQVCFDTLHMYGTDQMKSHDIMEYFQAYSPVSIEWVSKNACNVIWPDDISSAQALFYMSKGVKGMPVDGEMVTELDNGKGRSILLKNNNREVALHNETDVTMSEDEATLSDIDIPIPAGYWRLGMPHSKSKCLVIRFALFSDRKALMTESRKALFRGIFERNREINSKNPWGDLAKSWNRDTKTEEVAEPVPQPAPEMKHRLGFKRSQTASFDDEEKLGEKPKIPRMRMYADEEEAKIKRKKALAALKQAANAPKIKVEPKSSDLRNVICRNNAWDDVEPKEESEDAEVEEKDEFDASSTMESEVPLRLEMDLGSRLMNRRLKFTNPAPPTAFKRNEAADVRQRLDSKMTKQHRFKEELLKNRRLKSPPPAHRTARSRKHSTHSRQIGYKGERSDDEHYSDEEMGLKTNSKVTVVIKKPKLPAVASTVWSRVDTAPSRFDLGAKNRLRTSAAVLQERKTRDSSESTDDGSSSSSEEDSSESSEENENLNTSGNMSDGEDGIKSTILSRPGFRSELSSEHKMEDHKKPLRIEINNDHYKK